jgi:hypothetical protein
MNTLTILLLQRELDHLERHHALEILSAVERALPA